MYGLASYLSHKGSSSVALLRLTECFQVSLDLSMYIFISLRKWGSALSLPKISSTC